MTRHDINLMRFGQWWRRIVRSGYGYAELSRLTSRAQFPLYRAESTSAVLWGSLLPAALAGAVLIHPFVLALALIYPLQIIRIACRRGPNTRMAWYYATFIVIAKFAELEGILKFYAARASGLSFRRIDYKGSKA